MATTEVKRNKVKTYDEEGNLVSKVSVDEQEPKVSADEQEPELEDELA